MIPLLFVIIVTAIKQASQLPSARLPSLQPNADVCSFFSCSTGVRRRSPTHVRSRNNQHSGAYPSRWRVQELQMARHCRKFQSPRPVQRKCVLSPLRHYKCGDIVEVLADQPFPCDLILLYSNTENQGCHITTANLDGETNLKVRSIPARIPVCSTVQELSDLRGVIQCDKPNLRLYEFKGKIIINNKE